jgi:hypothetical protein
MLALGDHRRRRQPPTRREPDLRGHLVAEKADHTCGGERPQVRELLRVDEAHDRLVERDYRRDQDREHDRKPDDLLAPHTAQDERDPERDRRQRVAGVMDQVRKQLGAIARKPPGCRERRVGAMRPRLPWLIALPVMAAGSLGAHSLSYLFVSARTTEGAGEASERAGNGGTSYLVLFLGIVAATAIVAACARLLLARAGARRAGVSHWLFFVLPPLAFASQELAERLLNAEAFPFHAALEPRFLVGLLLQLPFGLLALLVARALLRVVERIVRTLAGRSRRLATGAPWQPGQIVDLPQIPALALGHAERGPPAR